MEAVAFPRGGRGRGGITHDTIAGRGRPQSRNKHWTPDGSRSHTPPNNINSERWERGGFRGGGRGRESGRGAVPKFHNVSLRLNNTSKPAPPPPMVQPEPEAEMEQFEEEHAEEEEEEEGDDGSGHIIEEPQLDSQEEREKFYQELVKAREVERKKAIAEGKMDDPLVPKRLEDAISVVGTCMDMCPRFERYRRERENNLFEWETIPGTKRVDHNRAVKMYERAAGDKTLPSDLRPPLVLRRTLNYLFHDLLPRGGFSATFNFIRDRSRSVRNDFTMQHITGPLAIECHDRCARFHILALHIKRDVPGFSIALEEQQLMNTLQSLKEFYEDQRGKYQSPTELEMRVYHRLIHIRDQKERHDDIPQHIIDHPVFKLTTEFRLHVQKHSAPISKTSKLVVTSEGMQIFAQLAAVLGEQGSNVMVFLVACILERLFGKDTIEDIESIKGNLTIQDLIDGVSTTAEQGFEEEGATGDDGFVDGYEEGGEEVDEIEEEQPQPVVSAPQPTVWGQTSAQPAISTTPASNPFNIQAQPNVFGSTGIFGGTPSVFGGPAFPVTTSSQPAATSVFGNLSSTPHNVFGGGSFMAASSTAVKPPAAPVASQTMSLTNDGGQGVQSTSAANPFGTSTFTVTPQPPPPAQPMGATTTTQSIPNFFASSLNPKATAFTPSPPKASPFFSQLPAPTTNATAASSSPFKTEATTSTPTPPKPSPFFSQPPATNGTASPFKTELKTQPTQPNVAQSAFPATSAFGPKPSSLAPQPTLPSFETEQEAAGQPPSLNRLVAPPLLKINTNTSSNSSGSQPSAGGAPGVAPSPRVPPPLNKMQPISLPSTPTGPPNPLLGHLRSALDSGRSLSPSSSGFLSSSPSGSLGLRGLSGSSSEILSPLVMATPGAGGKSTFLPNFTPLSTPMGSRVWSNEASPASGSGSRESLPLFVPPASPTKGGYFGNAVAVGKAGADLTTSTSSTTSTATVVPASSTPAPATATTTTTSVAVNGKGKAKASTFFTAASMYEDLAEVEEQKKLALSFAQKSSVVKRAFGRWVQKAVERAKWMEAVRQGDEYRERMRREGLGRSLGASRSQSGSRNGRNEVGGLRASRFGTPSEKKRRISDGAANGHGDDKMDISELEVSTNRRKRARKRMSTDYKRRQTDEELAKRFRENHEEHELRWAHGSFLKVIRDHVRSTPLNTSTSSMHSLSSSTSLSLSFMSSQPRPTDKTSHQHWNVWLSLNPESDATAIWMERKFGMPESGEWASESIFSIPLLPESKNGYPGLIVFENTPLGDVLDPLEKKYRVLDDCTRLREVINALSPRRHFIPSLLVVCWAEQEMDVVYKDFFDMLNKLVSDSTILSYQILPMTSSTNDLDNKLQTALSSMKLDVEGKLVKSLTMKGAFKVLEPAFITFVNEWTENCQFGPRVNWGLYGQVVHAAISILNVMSQLASFLLDVTEGIEQPQDPLPEFDYSQVDDRDSAYDDILDWLSGLDSRDDAMLIATDIQSHRNIGQDFPIRIFLEHLYEITQIRFERRNPTTTTSPRTVLTSNIKEAGDAFKEEIQPHQMKLLQVYNYSVRRSPKRRSYSITTSEQNSPEAKRPRLSDSVSSSQNSGLSSYLNGDADERTPSPTGTNVSLGTETSSGPTVTVAMLRALTKDLKKKYVRT